MVCFCETWLTSNSTCDSFLAVDGFSFFRRDRPNDRRGGGLLVYVNRELQPTRRLDLENPEIECLTLELNHSKWTESTQPLLSLLLLPTPKLPPCDFFSKSFN